MDDSTYPGHFQNPWGFQGQDGNLESSVRMQRTDTQSTSQSVDSGCTIATEASSATDYSAADSVHPKDDVYPEIVSYPDPPQLHQPHDAKELLRAAGSQYQQTGHHWSPELNRADLSLLFNTKADRENAAGQATENAHLFINGQQPSYHPTLSIVTSEAVDRAAQWYQAQGAEQPDRMGVQFVLKHVLAEHLCSRFGDTERLSHDMFQALDEAAYHLQTRLWGPNVRGICYLAIVTVLTELLGDPGQETNAPMGSKSVDLRRASPRPVTKLRAPEKEKHRCHYPGCGKTTNRQADLDRHYNTVHLDEEHQTKHLCDYKKCVRHTQAFTRQDHFRDHLRIFHKEDLLRRGNKGDDEWWESRNPHALFLGWWRCNRCLLRVDLGENGFTCAACGTQCEKERQRYRAVTQNPLPQQEEERRKGQSRRQLTGAASSSRRKRAAPVRP